ncbi:hypothetical protein GCM10022243_31370 [Saccharothrix violaceirubra]|uniref:Uncharacterized protein n=1 Tax=Saccharothrix violaceirubra TaxID=413306 RepID=A0A7W7T5P2_9PSEU|nr:twin-arginine translocation signal domain-containing protein [Saccharothrix violaceirubra]MBB4966761.1 hypothetical protein [Saccharothrix violaceirubra]
MSDERHSVSRRTFLTAAAIGGTAAAVGGLNGVAAQADPSAELPPAYEGDLVAVRGDRLIMVTPMEGELVIPVSHRTSTWFGGQSSLDALRPGQDITIGLDETGFGDRLWADITRIKGVITSVSGNDFEVDPGNGGHPRVLHLPDTARAALRGDYTRWENGYLVDIIGLRRDDSAVAVQAAAPQPGYHVDEMPEFGAAAGYPDLSDAAARQFDGKITWFDDAECKCKSRCRGHNAHASWSRVDKCDFMPARCRRIPVLSCGRKITVHNKCNKKSLSVEVIDCGPDNKRFCDSCTKCGRSPKGRIADLTKPTYVRIGGSLNAGCFTGWAKV